MADLDVELAKHGAILVEERVLRRIIKGHRKLRGVGLQVPHESCYTLPHVDLGQHVDREDLAIDLAALPGQVIVVACERGPIEAGSPEALSALWRVMYHAKIHQTFEQLLASRTLTLAAIRKRIHRVGQTEFDEIRTVLKQEDLLLPPVDEIAMYVEFVALYLELKHFAPSAIERTFPALFETAKIDATIALDFDADALLVAMRPAGAPEQPIIAAPTHDSLHDIDRPAVIGESARKSAAKAAAKAREKGNRSRAAILHYRAGLDRSGEADIAELVARLGKALAPRDARSEVDATTAARWVEALTPVAAFAARQSSQRFSVGARLLVDLQAACIVAEREVKVVDVFTWALSLGKKPVVRALPATREVRIAKHVRAAVAKIPACGVPSEELADALHEISALADTSVRKAMRPKIEGALDDVDLHPHSLPERVGEKKLVDELLDRAVAIGRLSIGNLRDAISKNDLKTNDLSLPELKSGDQLLRSDKILATSMDGVYRGGESYMRFLQKLSSLLFGTPLGRFLTLYLILPALGSIAVIEGLHHMIGPLWAKLFGVEPEISTPYTLGGCAAFLFLLIHVRPFRSLASWLGLKLWRLFKLLLWDIPRTLWRHRIMGRLLESRPHRWLIRPAVPAAIVWLAVPSHLELEWIGELRWPIAGAAYLVAMFVMNSRFGRMVEERFIDWAVRSGRHVTTRVLPGLVKLVLDVFVKLVELFDRAIYRVDEWLRFKSGQSRVILIAKGVLGAIWFVLTYFLRLYINLFIEPTVNPIKHFPVVTVAAKLIIPIIPALLDGVASATTPLLGSTLASGFAGFTVIVLPGLAGFLVWELKENWRLYRATRPKVMHALAIGHHGESMVGFLKPGFHSGTIPKLFTKLRRAAWKADERGVHKHKEGLHHVEEAVGKFADRQLVSMLNEVASFTATDVAVSHVDIGSNRIQIELVCPSVGNRPARIRFEQQSGWLVASTPEHGWIDQLDEHHRRIFEISLAGFYKLSGVEIVREQIEHVLQGDTKTLLPYDIADEGLLVWPNHTYDSEAVYNLRSSKLKPAVRGSRFEGNLPDLAGRHALFVREPLYWSVWSTAWQQIARGEPPMHLLVGPSLLPHAAIQAERAA
jgi:hypothetical protein